MNENERIDALLDLVDAERPPSDGHGPQLAVLGLASLGARGRFRPTVAGWSLLGERGRPFRSDTE